MQHTEISKLYHLHCQKKEGTGRKGEETEREVMGDRGARKKRARREAGREEGLNGISSISNSQLGKVTQH